MVFGVISFVPVRFKPGFNGVKVGNVLENGVKFRLTRTRIIITGAVTGAPLERGADGLGVLAFF